MGPPFSYADLTASLRITGDGRSDQYIYRPVSQQSFVAWAPPGALNPSSMMYRTHTTSGPGNVTIITGAQIAAFVPWTATYLAIVPPVTSAVSKTMKGVSGDVGVALIPWLPNIIALPTTIPASWALVYNFAVAEDYDLYLW